MLKFVHNDIWAEGVPELQDGFHDRAGGLRLLREGQRAAADLVSGVPQYAPRGLARAPHPVSRLLRALQKRNSEYTYPWRTLYRLLPGVLDLRQVGSDGIRSGIRFYKTIFRAIPRAYGASAAAGAHWYQYGEQRVRSCLCQLQKLLLRIL